MITRHGSPVVILGAFLSIAAGGFAYFLSRSLLVSLGTAAFCLMLCTFYANQARPIRTVTAPPRPSRFTVMARSSLFYITVGALVEVWGGVWHAYMSNGHPPQRDYVWFVCHGVLGSGLVLLLIGLLVGQIGRAARESELPPPEAMPTQRPAGTHAA